VQTLKCFESALTFALKVNDAPILQRKVIPKRQEKVARWDS
jgi:hypothetical protein